MYLTELGMMALGVFLIVPAALLAVVFWHWIAGK